MKKTFITLLALAGVALGADYTVENVWSADFGTAYTSGYQVSGTLTSTGTFHDAGKCAVDGGALSSGSQRIHMAGGVYGSWTDDFQFSITLTLGNPISASNGWPVFAEVAGNGKALRFGPYTNDGNYVAIDGTLVEGSKSSDMTFAVEAGSTYTVTLTKIGTALTLAVDGRDVAFAALSPDNVSGNITDIALGGNTANNYRINSTVHSISYGLVTVAESPVVPEPATATLSLLALAGLAARRRRR